MADEQEALAIARISNDLRTIFVRVMGKEPDPQVIKAEAEEFVAKYGPAATFEDLMA